MDATERIFDLPLDPKVAEELALATTQQGHHLSRLSFSRWESLTKIESRFGIIPLGTQLPVCIEKPHTQLHTHVVLLANDQETGRITLGEIAPSYPADERHPWEIIGVFEFTNGQAIFAGPVREVGLSPLTAAINGSEAGSARTYLLPQD